MDTTRNVNTYRVFYVDTFTPLPFAGNPAAIVPDAEGLTDRQMQAIAREINLPETCFLLPSNCADFRVRYFMPRAELSFAGHPTIATAYILVKEKFIRIEEPVTRLHLEANIGVFPVEIQVRSQNPVRVVMTQPAPTFGPVFTTVEIADCFSLQVSDLRSDCPSQVVSTGVPFLIVPIKDLQVLENVQMHRGPLAELCENAGVSAAFMFCLGGFKAESDAHARLFDPKGLSEDPYTGSAMGCLGAYIVHHGLRSGPHFLAEQGHIIGRPGEGELEILGTRERIAGVRLSGEAVKILEGNLYIYA